MNKVQEEGRRKKSTDIPSSFPRSVPSSSEILSSAITPLTAAQTDSPRLTADVLLAHALGVTRTQALAHPERQLSPEQHDQFNALLARAVQHEPLAYLVGHQEFYGYDFAVDPRALIPRPETELLIDLALAHPPTPPHIIDLGTGSGCLAITFALKLPNARVTALDISPATLALARLNAEYHRVADRIAFLQSDLLSALQSPTLQSPIPNYQLLVSNLPYVPTAEAARLPYEPALALDGGPDGLTLYRRLFTQIPSVMASPSRLLLELNANLSAETLALACAAFPSAQIELHPDLAGLPRVLDLTL